MTDFRFTGILGHTVYEEISTPESNEDAELFQELFGSFDGTEHILTDDTVAVPTTLNPPHSDFTTDHNGSGKKFIDSELVHIHHGMPTPLTIPASSGAHLSFLAPTNDNINDSDYHCQPPADGEPLNRENEDDAVVTKKKRKVKSSKLDDVEELPSEPIEMRKQTKRKFNTHIKAMQKFKNIPIAPPTFTKRTLKSPGQGLNPAEHIAPAMLANEWKDRDYEGKMNFFDYRRKKPPIEPDFYFPSQYQAMESHIHHSSTALFITIPTMRTMNSPKNTIQTATVLGKRAREEEQFLPSKRQNPNLQLTPPSASTNKSMHTQQYRPQTCVLLEELRVPNGHARLPQQSTYGGQPPAAHTASPAIVYNPRYVARRSLPTVTPREVHSQGSTPQPGPVIHLPNLSQASLDQGIIPEQHEVPSAHPSGYSLTPQRFAILSADWLKGIPELDGLRQPDTISIKKTPYKQYKPTFLVYRPQTILTLRSLSADSRAMVFELFRSLADTMRKNRPGSPEYAAAFLKAVRNLQTPLNTRPSKIDAGSTVDKPLVGQADEDSATPAAVVKETEVATVSSTPEAASLQSTHQAVEVQSAPPATPTSQGTKRKSPPEEEIAEQCEAKKARVERIDSQKAVWNARKEQVERWWAASHRNEPGKVPWFVKQDAWEKKLAGVEAKEKRYAVHKEAIDKWFSKRKDGKPHFNDWELDLDMWERDMRRKDCRHQAAQAAKAAQADGRSSYPAPPSPEADRTSESRGPEASTHMSKMDSAAELKDWRQRMEGKNREAWSHPKVKPCEKPDYPRDDSIEDASQRPNGRYLCAHGFPTNNPCCTKGLSRHGKVSSITKEVTPFRIYMERLIESGQLHPAHKDWTDWYDDKIAAKESHAAKRRNAVDAQREEQKLAEAAEQDQVGADTIVSASASVSLSIPKVTSQDYAIQPTPPAQNAATEGQPAVATPQVVEPSPTPAPNSEAAFRQMAEKAIDDPRMAFVDNINISFSLGDVGREKTIARIVWVLKKQRSNEKKPVEDAEVTQESETELSNNEALLLEGGDDSLYGGDDDSLFGGDDYNDEQL
ncbi:hypothetical protein T440DRAFT_522740 [Plenodomus tracheiphilus IPT5]|uniref:Uncharacterized protein n=1 Tax=Plenodomus tracheiphilus IPT5 TaxID=1408161 RepID=A0A6A7AQ85_9PLEO|nr:hypothetical protein T440DRAFT_522740 [Plenodomus tracheiphilus IPT5]